ncbi:MAG: alpha/beta fold hydrolase [Chloroflexi bacterium]|nr:alpha/beta fold hydrolase [Chloroflexota bacterium]
MFAQNFCYRLLLIILLFGPALSSASAQETTSVQNALIDCPFAMPTDEVIGQTALCGELTVPENWQEPGDRTIALRYVVLKTPSSAPFPDPVIYLEGGPGASALVNVPFLAGAFEEMRRYRDVIVYDQRGTAFSTPLFCPADVQGNPLPENFVPPELPTSPDPEIQAMLEGAQQLSAFTNAVNCRPYLEEQGFDLSQYSTANSVRDLVAMMDVLDYAAYNIYGISYGTNVALELFRYYEENDSADLPVLRSGIIDGVVPPNVDTRGGQGYISGYNVMRVFEDCEADSACGAAFPNIRQRAVDLLLQVEQTPLTIGEETIEFENLRRVLTNGLNYKQDDASGLVIGIGAQYFPLMIAELEQGIATTFVGLRDGTLPPASPAAAGTQPENPFANVASEARTLAGTARDLADQIERLQLESSRAGAALASGLPLPEFFVQEVRIGINQLDYLTASFFPTMFDLLLSDARTREDLASFGTSLNAETGAIVGLMSDADVEEAYRLLESIRPTIASANTIALDVISCNDRYGSFDLEALFAGFRSFEVPRLINKVDVAVNAKITCTMLGLASEDATLRPPVVTDLPILVSNGSVDAETPVEWGEAAYDSLENAFFITFAYYPHGASTQFDCGPAVAAAFFLDPSRLPDTGCVDDLQAVSFPFVLSGAE